MERRALLKHPQLLAAQLENPEELARGTLRLQHLCQDSWRTCLSDWYSWRAASLAAPRLSACFCSPSSSSWSLGTCSDHHWEVNQGHLPMPPGADAGGRHLT